MTEYDKLDRFYENLIEQSAAVANDVMKRWLTTLSVGNGAALFGAVTIATNHNSAYAYFLVPSMWLFLVGVSAASIAFACLGAAWRAQEQSWRFSASNSTWEALEKPENVEQQIVDELDEKTDRCLKWAALTAVVACVTFFLGVAIPLTQVTWKAATGTL